MSAWTMVSGQLMNLWRSSIFSAINSLSSCRAFFSHSVSGLTGNGASRRNTQVSIILRISVVQEKIDLLPLDQRILRSRTARILLATLMALPLPAKLLGWMPFTVVIVLANFVVAVRIMAQLFDLRRAFPKPEEEPKYGES